MRLRAAVLVLLAIVLAPVPVVVTASAASACSCVESGSEDFIDRADVVVTGTLADIETSGGMNSVDPTWYVLDVDEVFQGEATDTMVFASAAHGASCGLENMQTGTRYVVFLRDGSGDDPRLSDGLVADLCGGTAPYDGTGEVADALAELGGEPPEPGTTGSVPIVTGPAQRWLIGAGAALVAAGVVPLVLRLRRRSS